MSPFKRKRGAASVKTSGLVTMALCPCPGNSTIRLSDNMACSASVVRLKRGMLALPRSSRIGKRNPANRRTWA